MDTLSKNTRKFHTSGSTNSNNQNGHLNRQVKSSLGSASFTQTRSLNLISLAQLAEFDDSNLLDRMSKLP